MAKETDTSEVHLLREKTVWTDVKGRVLVIFRREFDFFGGKHRPGAVQILMVEPLTLISRPHAEVEQLIRAGKMKFWKECLPPDTDNHGSI